MPRNLRSMPWPQRQRRKIYPVFLPWLGCESRCIFCAQELQTGRRAPDGETEVLALLTICEMELLKQAAKTPQPQLAFYGGTFTALPEHLWRICLDFARRLKTAGLISGFRCSTRPDCVARERLEEMKNCGCELVELGIQSYNSRILAAARRGYSREEALEACRLVAEAGLGPGVQLMPGLPQSTPAAFIEDVEHALACGAACLRFYPCLVLAGSPLARLWSSGRFRPWDLHETLDTLANGWLLAANRGIAVIRMGLAPQAGLAESVLAGPCHPALGSRVMGRALALAVRGLLDDKPDDAPWHLKLPEQAQGYIRGWKGELAAHWRSLGAGEVIYWERQELEAGWD